MVDPVSLRLSAVGDGGLPHAVRATAVLLQQGSALQADATGAELGRLPCERASFDCRALTVAVFHKQHTATTEQALIEADEGREAAAGLSAPPRSRVHAVEGPRPRPAGRPREDAPRGPAQRFFRQAACAAVTSHDGGARRCTRSATGAGRRPAERRHRLHARAPAAWGVRGCMVKSGK